MNTARTLWQRLAPWGARERTAATALLLVLVVGAARTPEGVWRAQSMFAGEQQTARAGVHAVAFSTGPLDEVALEGVADYTAPTLPSRRVLTGELPAPRAPNAAQL